MEQRVEAIMCSCQCEAGSAVQDVKHVIEDCAHTKAAVDNLELKLKNVLSKTSTKIASELLSNVSESRGQLLAAVLHLPNMEGCTASKVNDACSKEICKFMETLQHTMHSL